MKQTNPISIFFTIVFGGLVLMFACVGMFTVGGLVWRSMDHSGSTAASKAPVDGAGVALASSIQAPRYSASEEEDLIAAATQSLPKSQVGQMTAKAYLVKDLSTGAVLSGNNQNQLLPVASLTKLVTAVVAHKLIPDTARIPITNSVIKTYGNTAGFIPGETFAASDLLYPLLMVSSNDAAEAFARSYGRDKFIQAMNDFAQSIGAYRTYFADPSGLDAKNVSTANDMALIIDWVQKNQSDIMAITTLKSKTLRSHTWINPTHFLSWSYYAGGKNGYLPEANRTSASLFKWGDKGSMYAIILLGSSQRDADTLALLKKIQK